jgi:hypothetical protein
MGRYARAFWAGGTLIAGQVAYLLHLLGHYKPIYV